MKVIMDSDSLIKLTKAKAKEIVLFKKKVISREDAESYINNLKEMVSDEEYYLAIREVT